MNYKVVLSILGKTMLIEALLLIVPMLVGVYYQEDNLMAFLIPIIGLCVVGGPLSFLKSEDGAMYAKEGFVTVALAWIIMSLIGAVPFVLGGEITSYIDAVFETVSGFTTTGASILNNVEKLSKSMMFWRIFTHWIGGMGVLVFVLAVMPGYSAGAMHVFRAESPGPTVGKLVSKLSFTARILYAIYMVMTVIQVVLLLFGGNDLYSSILLSFSTAGTGGFGLLNSSAGSYSDYTQIVLSVFMLLFGVNFNVYYLILIGNFSKAFKCEEVRVYLIAILVTTLAVAINITSLIGNFGQALKHAFFQVTSIGSTTGLTTYDYTMWPAFSQAILLLLTVMGACGGSTGGGMKIARVCILYKSCSSEFKRLIHPRAVVTTKFEGEPITKDTESNVKTFFILWVLIVVVSTLLLSLDGYFSVFDNFSATLACIGNVGPGFGLVGPTYNYAGYSDLSTILLSLVMLVGRLEIFPILILFAPRAWRRA